MGINISNGEVHGGGCSSSIRSSGNSDIRGSNDSDIRGSNDSDIRNTSREDAYKQSSGSVIAQINQVDSSSIKYKMVLVEGLQKLHEDKKYSGEPTVNPKWPQIAQMNGLLNFSHPLPMQKYNELDRMYLANSIQQ